MIWRFKEMNLTPFLTARVADVLVSLLREIHIALVPTMGPRDVALLYRRSLWLTPSLQPPLRIQDETQTDADAHFDALRWMLAHQTGADVIASGAALLQTFYDLLVDLFGLSMTERVLRCVWASYLPSLDE